MNPELLDLLLTVLAMAAAIGLSAFAALGVPGILAYLGLLELPATLAGLAAPPVWGTLLGFVLIELMAARRRLFDLGWTVLQTLVKPQAAFLLAALGLSTAAPSTQWTAALAAAALALLLHVPILALRVAAHTAGPTPTPGLIAAAQWLLASTISTLGASTPPLGAAAAAMLFLSPLPWLPQIWGAAALPIVACLWRLKRPEHLRRWHTGLGGLPAPLRNAVAAEFEGRTQSVKCTPATLARIGSNRPFCRGHLVVAPDRAPIFAHRRGFRPTVLSLGSGRAGSDDELLLETLEAQATVPYALCLGPEAAPVSAILAAIEGTEPAGSGVEPGATQVYKQV